MNGNQNSKDGIITLIFCIALTFNLVHLSANCVHVPDFKNGPLAGEQDTGFALMVVTDTDREVVDPKGQGGSSAQYSHGSTSARSFCNETVDAGPDQVLCPPGGSVLLEGSFSGSDFLELGWTPEAGLSDPNVLQPIANVNLTTTYVLDISALSGENLIENGDFEMGNVGFTSDYNFNDLSTGFLAPGEYSIQTNSAVGNPAWAQCGDHTTGTGNMFLTDGATMAGLQLWCQTVDVEPDTDYFFQFFVTSVFPTSPANIEVNFDGTPIGTVSPTSTTCEWVEFSAVWNSGGLSSVTICLENLNLVLGGNDFAIDDISLFQICQYSDSVTVTVPDEITTQKEALICSGEFVEVGGQQFFDPGEYEILLTSAAGCDSIVELQLDVLEVEAIVADPLPITCENEEVLLDGSSSTGSEFNWITFDGLILSPTDESSAVAGAPGTYEMVVTASQDGVSCEDFFSVVVPIDTIAPVFDIEEPEPLSCSDSIATLQAQAPMLPPNAIIEWDPGTGEIVSGANSLSPMVQGAGVYTLTITDPNNGCSTKRSVELLSDTLTPVIEAEDLYFLTCRDTLIELSVNVISPDSDFVFSWTTDKGNFAGNENTLQPLVDAPGIYTILVKDTLTGCESSAEIEVREDFFLPQIELPATDTFPCAEDSRNLSVSVVPASNNYIFQWTTTNGNILGGDQTDNPEIGSEGEYQLILENTVNGCLDTAKIEIIEDCPCTTRAGEFQINGLDLCEGDDIDISTLNLEGTVEEEDFELFYVLHYGSADEIDSILAFSEGASIEWSPDFEIGTTYFITAVISTVEDGEINFDEDCIDFSDGIPVAWSSGPEIEIGGLSEVCLGDELFLIVESNGPFPFKIQLTSNSGETVETFINEADELVSLPGIMGETIWQITSLDSECEATFSGEFTSIVTEPLEISFLTPPPTCNNELFGSTLDLNDLIVEENIDGVWLLDEGEIAGGIIDFDGFDAGEYEIVFNTIGFEEPCPGSRWTLTVEVEECDCPSVSLPESLLICSDSINIGLDDLAADEPVTGEWSLSNPNEISPAPVIENESVVGAVDVSGVFELLFNLVDSLPEECETEYIIDLEIEQFLSAGNSLPDPNELCENDTNEIELFEYIVDFSDGGVWVDENGDQVDDVLNVSDLEIGGNTFRYLIESEGVCSSDEVEINIELLTAPESRIISDDPLCPGEKTGSIMALSLDPENPISEIILNGMPAGEVDLTNLSAGTYSLQITGSNGCSGPVEMVELQEPDEFFISLGEDIEAQLFDELVLFFETDLPDSLISTVVWSDDRGPVEENAIKITYTVESDTRIRIVLTTTDGCILEDEINLIATVAEQSVYLPTVFRPTSAISANEVFGPLGQDAIQLINHFQIFDRWGNQVHEAKNISPDSPDLFWNGKIKSEAAGEGVYVYQLIYTDLTGKEVVKKGDVLVIR
ncbi:MAG: hypothetical protein EA411_07210 [Saprospirales bacterium]|nr:MAG: hypothetical protein EA411_07210 [Saprospirales bacterium]